MNLVEELELPPGPTLVIHKEAECLAESLDKLNAFNIKIPSPILRDYEWPGIYKPFDHQRGQQRERVEATVERVRNGALLEQKPVACPLSGAGVKRCGERIVRILSAEQASLPRPCRLG